MSRETVNLEAFLQSKNAELSALANRLKKKRQAAVDEHQAFMEEHRRQFDIVQSQAQNVLDQRGTELKAIEDRHARLKENLSQELDGSQELLGLVARLLEKG